MIGGLKECGTFAGEKKGTFFLVIQFSTYTLYFKAYINLTFQEYSIRCLPIRNGCLFVRTPMPTLFQASYYPWREKVFLGKRLLTTVNCVKSLKNSLGYYRHGNLPAYGCFMKITGS